MRKWIYLAIGILLVINMVVSLYFAFADSNIILGIFQTLWGIVGIFLLRSSIKLFTKSKRKAESV